MSTRLISRIWVCKQAMHTTTEYDHNPQGRSRLWRRLLDRVVGQDKYREDHDVRGTQRPRLSESAPLWASGLLLQEPAA